MAEPKENESKIKTNIDFSFLEKVVVPSAAIFFSFLAALFSTIVLWVGNEKVGKLQENQTDIQRQLQEVQITQQASQFSKELQQKYIEIFYKEISEGDSRRQRMALELLLYIEPETGKKLNEWARSSNVLKPEAITTANRVEEQIQSNLQKSRFQIFIHLGEINQRPVPSQREIRQALSSQGFQITGFDNASDVYGPGVDYFYDGDRAVAEEVTKIINSLLPKEATQLKVRKQTGSQREGVLGVWF
jgi:hypothetical protein